MELAKIVVNDFEGAPFAEHNMPCAVCKEDKAVLNLDIGVMLPCRKCQKDGWRTDWYRTGSLLHRLIKWVHND